LSESIIHKHLHAHHHHHQQQLFETRRRRGHHQQQHHGVSIKVGAAHVESSRAASPGTVVAVDRTGVRVACAEGLLVLTQLQRPGGRMLPVAEFLGGYPLTVGEILVSVDMPAFVADRPFPRLPKA
jgi:methionyl-tRNA formyltransferase